jgi:hypothetical protein
MRNARRNTKPTGGVKSLIPSIPIYAANIYVSSANIYSVIGPVYI